MVQYSYDAWGNHEIRGRDPALVSLNPFRYRGYYYDIETKLYYLQTRYYDPEVGRFINMDSIDYADPESINGLNLYAYCNNNPVMFVDPTGHLAAIIGALIFAAILSGTIGGATSAVFTAIKGGNSLECLGAFVGGFITGALLGVAMTLGGGLAVAAYAPTALNLLGVGAFLTVGTYFGGIGAYWAESAISGETFKWDIAKKFGALTLAQGLISFGIGYAMGAAGFYESLRPGRGYMSALKTTSDTFTMEVSKSGIKAIWYGIKTFYYGTMAYFGENLGQMTVRTFVKGIFVSPWGLLKNYI